MTALTDSFGEEAETKSIYCRYRGIFYLVLHGCVYVLVCIQCLNYDLPRMQLA